MHFLPTETLPANHYLPALYVSVVFHSSWRKIFQPSSPMFPTFPSRTPTWNSPLRWWQFQPSSPVFPTFPSRTPTWNSLLHWWQFNYSALLVFNTTFLPSQDGIARSLAAILFSNTLCFSMDSMSLLFHDICV